MNIGILGSGNVGKALGEAWAKVGHTVAYGTREPGTTEAAVKTAEVVAIALPWEAAQKVVESLDLKGKIVFDCTNPLLPDFSSAVDASTSAGELVAKWAKGAAVVKIFNTTGSNNMADSSYGNEPPVMFYCGGDAAAKAVAVRLAGELGFEPMDAGPIENSRLLEPLARLWIWLAYKGGLGREIAFRLVRR